MLTLEQQVEAKDLIRRCLMQVSAREERIIRLRFGLGGCGEHEEKEIAEEFGLSRGRVNQLAARAMRRMSKAAMPPVPARRKTSTEPSGILLLRKLLKQMWVLPEFERVAGVTGDDRLVMRNAARTIGTVSQGVALAEAFYRNLPMTLDNGHWYLRETAHDVWDDRGIMRLALRATFVDAARYWDIRRHWGHGGSAVQAEARC